MKLPAIAALASLALMGSFAQSEETKITRAGVSRDEFRSVAPALDKYAQDRLLGNVWKRPGLNARDRSVVTLAALIARNQTVEMQPT